MAIGDQRKEFEDFKCSKGDQVRGAGLRCFILNNNNMRCMIN